MPVEPYRERIERWRREAENVSRGNVARAVPDSPAEISLRQIAKGRRNASAKMLARIARSLGKLPEEFPEVRLAQARAALDERVVGLDQAIAALAEIERAIGAAADEPPTLPGALGRDLSKRPTKPRSPRQTGSQEEPETAEGSG
jgi:transcriptional regulator with XRE-family HTH domain